jgi:phosphate:Na+ symporter
VFRTALALLLLSVSLTLADGYTVEESGNSQHGRVGSILQQQLTVTVLDSLHRPVAGVQVEFTVNSPGGSIAVPFSGINPIVLEGDSVSGAIDGLRLITGPDGVAAVSLKLGDRTGNNNVDAVILLPDGSEDCIHFFALSIDLMQIIFQIVGGLAIFLLGMKTMSESLQRVSGSRMRTIMKRVTGNRFAGLMTGAMTTAVVQSSSAITVIAVGLVNTGLMTFEQSLGVILGSNIGTTITGQLLAFNITDFAFPMVAVGFALYAFSRKKKQQFWGRVIIGLGLIFLGMAIMKQVLDPIKTSASVKAFFMHFSSNPIMGIVAGTLITMIVQSSSATVGLTMTLAGAGLISIEGALYLVLGDNLGTTVTAQLASIGAGRAARRTAVGHTFIKLIEATYFALILSIPGNPFLRLVQMTSDSIMRQVANAHSIFNIFNSFLFLPLIPLVAKVCRFIIPVKESEVFRTEIQLEEHLLDTPAMAIVEIERETIRMAEVARETVMAGMSCFMTGSPGSDNVIKKEDQVDDMQRDITVYASKLFQRDLSEDVSLRLPVLLHTINDIERVSDHAVNMVEARERISVNIAEAFGELPEAAREAFSIVDSMTALIVSSLTGHDRKASQAVLAFEERLNRLDERVKDYYSESLSKFGLADLTGLAILDFINYCERIGDHLTNVAQSLLGGGLWHGTDDRT